MTGRYADWFPRQRVTLEDELHQCALADRWRTEAGRQDAFLTLVAHGIDPRPTAWQDRLFGLTKGSTAR